MIVLSVLPRIMAAFDDLRENSTVIYNILEFTSMHVKNYPQTH